MLRLHLLRHFSMMRRRWLKANTATAEHGRPHTELLITHSTGAEAPAPQYAPPPVLVGSGDVGLTPKAATRKL